MKNKLTDKNYWKEAYQKYNLPRVIKLNNYRNKRFDKLFKEILHKDSKKKLLEVGCGASAWLVYFQKEFNYQVYGVDYSELGCDLARKNLAINQADGVISCEDIFNNSFENETFDIVFSTGVVEHFSDPSEILEIMSNLLKPGGILITSIPNFGGLNGYLLKKLAKEDYEKHNILTVMDLKRLYAKLDIEPVRVQYFASFCLGTVPWNKIQSYSKFTVNVVSKLTNILQKIVTSFLSFTNIAPESRLFSPYIIAIGRKKF